MKDDTALNCINQVAIPTTCTKCVKQWLGKMYCAIVVLKSNISMLCLDILD